MRIKILLMAVVLTGLLFSLSASAQVSCANPETTEIECIDPPVPLSVTGQSFVRDIPKFDTSLGELQSVRIISEACGYARLDLDSEHPAPTTWFVITRGGIVITLPDGKQVFSTFGTPQGEEDEIFTEADNDGTPDFITTDSGFIEYGTPEDPICNQNESVYDTEADMAIFKGSAGETLKIDIVTIANLNIRNPDSNSFASNSISRAGGDVCVEYTYCPPQEFCINGSKIDACTDEPISGWLITLRDDTGAVVATDTTDADGLYSFCDLKPGNYEVCEETRADWEAIGPTCYDVEIIDDDVVVTAFENTQGSCISGYKYSGATGEVGLSGWTIQLKDSTGAVIDSTTTGTDGYFEFCGFESGSYTVCEVLKSGWKAITPICIDVTLEECEDSEPIIFRNEPVNLVCVCPFFIKNDLYTGNCKEIKVVDATKGLLANDPPGSYILNPDSIVIEKNTDGRYGSIEVNEDGSFTWDPTGATALRSGTYVIFKYWANNGLCDSRYAGIAKIQVTCH